MGFSCIFARMHQTNSPCCSRPGLDFSWAAWLTKSMQERFTPKALRDSQAAAQDTHKSKQDQFKASTGVRWWGGSKDGCGCRNLGRCPTLTEDTDGPVRPLIVTVPLIRKNNQLSGGVFVKSIVSIVGGDRFQVHPICSMHTAI